MRSRNRRGAATGERREHGGEVHLLERLAVAEIRADVAHMRIIAWNPESGVQPTDAWSPPGRASRSRSGAARELRVRLGHVGRGRFVPAHHELQPLAVLVHRVDRRQEALAGNAEHRVGPVHQELVDEDSPRLPLRCS